MHYMVDPIYPKDLEQEGERPTDAEVRGWHMFETCVKGWLRFAAWSCAMPSPIRGFQHTASGELLSLLPCILQGHVQGRGEPQDVG